MGAFPPCTACPYPYRRIYAQGGNYADSPGGLFPLDKPSFQSCYFAAVDWVNSVDITTVPFGSIRYRDYGGQSSTKSDCTYVDHGNLINNPTNVHGAGDGSVPANTTDFGAITAGGSELSYMGLDNPVFGVNAGGYQMALFGGGLGIPAHGWFAISRIMVDLNAAKCADKWSLVWWYPPSIPVSGFYTIQCRCDSASLGSCDACINGSTPNALCVDIPPASNSFFSPQADTDLPCSSQYFVPGFNCVDLV